MMAETLTTSTTNHEMPSTLAAPAGSATPAVPAMPHTRQTGSSSEATATQRLLLISPVRNEQAYLELVADAVAAQTRPPDLWVVVDDGSTDRTPRILGRADWADRLPARAGYLQAAQDRCCTGPSGDRR